MCPTLLIGQDSLFTKKKIPNSQLNTLFSFYIQDGEHAVVTGGQGSEAMQVYGLDVSFLKPIDSTRQWLVDFGVDVITSASTDQIDFIMSSASRTDGHGTLQVGYNHGLKKKRLELGVAASMGVESDYFSRGLHLWSNYTSKSGMTKLSANLNAYFDDLRWGRLQQGTYRPITLIYPRELRGVQWFDIHHRNSFNALFSIRQDINRRMSLGLFPGLVYQEGVLSTPFHRVYFFNSDSVKIESLPRERWKVPFGIQLNAFVSSDMVSRSYYQLYWDNFGILAHSLNQDLAIKWNPYITTTPFVRFYIQRGTPYFQPYKMHDIQAVYYTSDYDLSSFYSLKLGLAWRQSLKRLNPQKPWGLSQWAIRYAYYYRSDGLQAHMISTNFKWK